MAKYCEIQWSDMHEFCVSNGLKLLNPPVVGSDYKVVNWNLLSQPGFVLPAHVVTVPALDLYRPIKTGELVYGKRVYMQGSTRQLTLRIYTTIDPWAGAAREKGTDAIRVALFWREIEADAAGNETALPSRLIGGDRKCLRVMGWRKNIADRLENWPDLLGPECNKCGRPMALRSGKNGDFWGCTGYRKDNPAACRNTMPMGGPVVPVGDPGAPACPICNKPMKLRNGSRGQFYGCTGYPSCRGTRDKAAS